METTKINKVMIGEALVGDGNEVAHVDLIIGPRGSGAETAFCIALTNQKRGDNALLSVIAPNRSRMSQPRMPRIWCSGPWVGPCPVTTWW